MPRANEGPRTYLTRDGMRVAGHPREVVRQLRDAQWEAPEEKREWMEQVAERVRHLDPSGRAALTYSNAEEFLEELLRVGLLTMAD